MTPLDLPSVAADVAELYEPLAEERKISLALLPSLGRHHRGQRSLIAQALAKSGGQRHQIHAPKAARCGSRPHPASRAWTCGWPTAGRAFPRKTAPGWWSVFVRLEASRHSPGTGLGLSLVAAVAHFHNAELVLEDNQPTGLKAILRFPRTALRAPASQNRRRIGYKTRPCCAFPPPPSIPRAPPA